jgi:hypothetical protein
MWRSSRGTPRLFNWKKKHMTLAVNCVLPNELHYWHCFVHRIRAANFKGVFCVRYVTAKPWIRYCQGIFRDKAKIDRRSSCCWLYNQTRMMYWRVFWSSDLLVSFFRDNGSSRDDEGQFTLSMFIRTLFCCQRIACDIHIHAFTATTRIKKFHGEEIRAQNNICRPLRIDLYHLYVHLLADRVAYRGGGVLGC